MPLAPLILLDEKRDHVVQPVEEIPGTLPECSWQANCVVSIAENDAAGCVSIQGHRSDVLASPRYPLSIACRPGSTTLRIAQGTRSACLYGCDRYIIHGTPLSRFRSFRPISGSRHDSLALPAGQQCEHTIGWFEYWTCPSIFWIEVTGTPAAIMRQAKVCLNW